MAPKPFFAYRSFKRELPTMRAMAAAGIDTFCLIAAHTLNSLGTPYSEYAPVWIADGVYDFGPVDRMIDDCLRICPNARIICMIDLNTPEWWTHSFSTMHDCRPDSYLELGRVADDPLWREKTRAYLQAVLRHVDGHYGDHVFLYGLLGGHTTEWYDNSLGQESPSRRAAWRQWCLDRGRPDPVDIPSASSREASAHGMLRDPQDEAVAIDYVRFCNEQIGGALLHFAAAARDVVGDRAQLGAFYGYTLIPGPRKCILQGHMDLDRVSRSGLLDFILAPAVYGPPRPMGGGSGVLLPVDSLRHHGVGYLHESDHRTATYNTDLSPHVRAIDGTAWPDEAATVAGLRREFCLALLRGAAIWWFDMWGHWYDGHNVKRALGQMKALWDNWHDRPGAPAAEVCVFTDSESWLHCNPGSEDLPAYMTRPTAALQRLGASVAYHSMADLGTLDLSPCKLAIFPALFVVDDARRRLLAERVCRDGRTVLWFDRAGIIADGRYDPANVEQLCGMSPGGTGLTRRDMGDWYSVVAHEPIDDPAVFRAVAREAGVHLYVEDGDPVWATADLVAVHTAAAGEKTIRLPHRAAEVRELFSGRLVATDVDTFRDVFAAPATHLYHCTATSAQA